MFLFKELIDLWKSDNSLVQALNDSYLMLENTKEMFKESVKSLRVTDDGDIKIDVYEKDQLVNKYERDVRKKVLKYLAITGGANIIPALILTSIVIDIERIGDYTKNIMDLAVDHPRRLHPAKYHDELKKIEDTMSEMFNELIPALMESNQSVAKTLINEKDWILRRCDAIVSELIKNETSELTVSDAVTSALYVRYLKRIAAHLMNIASSIIQPFEGIGFREIVD